MITLVTRTDLLPHGGSLADRLPPEATHVRVIVRCKDKRAAKTMLASRRVPDSVYASLRAPASVDSVSAAVTRYAEDRPASVYVAFRTPAPTDKFPPEFHVMELDQAGGPAYIGRVQKVGSDNDPVPPIIELLPGHLTLRVVAVAGTDGVLDCPIPAGARKVVPGLPAGAKQCSIIVASPRRTGISAVGLHHDALSTLGTHGLKWSDTLVDMDGSKDVALLIRDDVIDQAVGGVFLLIKVPGATAVVRSSYQDNQTVYEYLGQIAWDTSSGKSVCRWWPADETPPGPPVERRYLEWIADRYERNLDSALAGATRDLEEAVARIARMRDSKGSLLGLSRASSDLYAVAAAVAEAAGIARSPEVLGEAGR